MFGIENNVDHSWLFIVTEDKNVIFRQHFKQHPVNIQNSHNGFEQLTVTVDIAEVWSYPAHHDLLVAGNLHSVFLILRLLLFIIYCWLIAQSTAQGHLRALFWGHPCKHSIA